MLVSTAIAFGFVPKYSCGDSQGNGPDGKPVPACKGVAPGVPCCTKASNMGWRYFLYAMGAICLFIFFLRFVVFRFQESPKFLLYRGKDAKAAKVLQHIAQFNGCVSTVTLETFEALANEEDTLSDRDGKKPILGGGPRQKGLGIGGKAKVEFQRYKMLFATKGIAYLTILVWIIYMFDYWGFSIAGELFSGEWVDP